MRGPCLCTEFLWVLLSLLVCVFNRTVPRCNCSWCGLGHCFNNNTRVSVLPSHSPVSAALHLCLSSFGKTLPCC
jgi:hypothetical protein